MPIYMFPDVEELVSDLKTIRAVIAVPCTVQLQVTPTHWVCHLGSVTALGGHCGTGALRPNASNDALQDLAADLIAQCRRALHRGS